MAPEPVLVCRSTREGTAGNLVCYRCAAIEDYILAVEKAERIYAGQLNPVQLVTALRKIWNGGTYHRQGARAYQQEYWQWDLIMPNATTSPLDLTRSRGDQRFTDMERWVLRGIQCLWTERLHGCIDFGHTLTGIDGSNHPHTSTTLLRELASSDLLVAAVTWSGDVGSAYQAIVAGTAASTAWDGLCSKDDLLGDVDGVVLGRRYQASQPFSRQLRTYYLGSNTRASIFQAFDQVYQPARQNSYAPAIGSGPLPAWALDPWASYVQAFVDAKKVLTPTWNDRALNDVLQRWAQFLRNGRAGRERHDHDTQYMRANQSTLPGIH